jgi:high-affinity K+ transport system ATPase subunit B
MESLRHAGFDGGLHDVLLPFVGIKAIDLVVHNLLGV